jgi:ligand-binding SRPBCC domain-containing protein
VAEFVYRSIVPIAAERLFRWHEQPGALPALLPFSRWVRIEHREGGIRDGGRVVFSVGAGPIRFRCEARHFGFVEGRQFCDEQVRGPFARWRHVHRIEPVAPDQSLYEDRIVYELPGGAVVNAVFGRMAARLLERAFERRHATVRRLAAAPADRT